MNMSMSVNITKEIPDAGEARRMLMREFCSQMKIRVDNLDLLSLAFTHTSFAHETTRYPRNGHNERLEFLGDSVLSLIVTTYMYDNFGHFDEGKLTKLRAQVVCETSLYQCAKAHNFSRYMRMGNGEMANNGNERPSILADAFEAVLGAFYLDQGFAASERYVLDLLGQEIVDVCNGKIMMGDYKSMLQEYLQKTEQLGVTYQLLEVEGPEHRRHFTSGVFVAEKMMGTGSGHTKKESEQKAAQMALEKIKNAKENE